MGAKGFGQLHKIRQAFRPALRITLAMQQFELANNMTDAESLDLAAFGSIDIRRASHVEPDAAGQWWADLAPVGGSRLGPLA